MKTIDILKPNFDTIFSESNQKKLIRFIGCIDARSSFYSGIDFGKEYAIAKGMVDEQ